MKIRTGFVSNSSSSSFLCDFCGNDVSGWDMGLSEAEMFQCVNHHTVCLSHLTDEEKDLVEHPFKTKEEFIQALVTFKEENSESTYWSERVNNLLAEITDENWEDLVQEDFMCNFTDGSNYGVPASVCPLCNFKDIMSDDLSKYLMVVLGQTKEQVLETIKRRSKTYKEFKTFIDGK